MKNMDNMIIFSFHKLSRFCGIRVRLVIFKKILKFLGLNKKFMRISNGTSFFILKYLLIYYLFFKYFQKKKKKENNKEDISCHST